MDLSPKSSKLHFAMLGLFLRASYVNSNPHTQNLTIKSLHCINKLYAVVQSCDLSTQEAERGRIESSKPTLGYLQSELKAGPESLGRPCLKMKATEKNVNIAVTVELLPNSWVLGSTPSTTETNKEWNRASFLN